MTHEEISLLYKGKEELFRDLANALGKGFMQILLYRDKLGPFPPTGDQARDFFESLDASDEITSDMADDDNRYLQEFDRGQEADEIENLDPKSISSFKELTERCASVARLYALICTAKGIDSLESLNRFEKYTHLLACKAYELLGYWTAKFGEKKRNRNNVSKRTVIRDARKADIRAQWEAERNNHPDLFESPEGMSASKDQRKRKAELRNIERDFINKTALVLKVTARTVHDILTEIKREAEQQAQTLK